MKSIGCRCFSRLVIALLVACFLPGCSKSSLKLPSLKMPKIPKLFGGKDKTKADETRIEDDDSPGVPGNRMAGVVHLVNDRGHFVLVKSSTGGRIKVPEGTVWMSYDANGRPSSKLKVSEERKGVFVVADIVNGSPSRGDTVVLHGLMDKEGKINTVTSPDGKEKQILE